MSKCCLIEGCQSSHHAHGYCSKHLHQIQRHGRITPELERDCYTAGDECKAAGCTARPVAKGLCKKHSLQISRHGHLLTKTIRDRNEVIIFQDYAEIVLCNKKSEPVASTLIDLEDLSMVQKIKWSLSDGYVINRIVGKLHRYVLGVPKGYVVDHINHNTLDNRKSNLRVCQQSQNNMNTVLRKDNTSGIKGVYFNNRTGKWESEINAFGKRMYVGSSYDKDEIIAKRQLAEEKYFGEFRYSGGI